MRSSTLIALLPLLAATSIAANTLPTHHHHHQTRQSHDDESNLNNHNNDNIRRISRKSLSFGPIHKHARFVTPNPDLDLDAESIITTSHPEGGWTIKSVAEGLVSSIEGFEGAVEGEDYYIRTDTYTDPRSGITHIYIKQLLNGLEVVDGDINVNVDENGRIISFGDNFARGTAEVKQQDTFTDLIQRLTRPHHGHRGETSECLDLGSKIEVIKTEMSELRAAIHKATYTGPLPEDEVVGVMRMVNSAVGLVKDYLLGVPSGTTSTSASTELAEFEREVEVLLRHLESSKGIKDLDGLLNRFDLVRAHLERLEDHASVVCAHGRERNTITPEGETLSVQVEHGPVEAVLSLLRHLSPRPADLPTEQEMRAEVQLEHDQTHPTFAPPTTGSSAPGFLIKGLPGVQDGGVVGPVQVRMGYHQTSEGGLSLVWRCVVEMKENWYEASVDVVDLGVVSVVDWASDAPPSAKRSKKGGKQKPLPIPHKKGKPYTYTVFPFGVNDPSVGNLSSVHAPWDPIASPAGWHAVPDSSNPYARQSIPGQKTGLKGPWVEGYEPVDGEMSEGFAKNETWSSFATTMGNNVFAQEDWEGASNWLHNDRPVNSSYIFDYEYGEPDGLRPKEYIDLAVTQLFYTSNIYHDLLYRLGFDELSGNFQMDNFGKGGLGGDGVICQAQDGSGTDNANFMTPPDGSQPRMRMYVWDTATPFRDGDLEAGIVIHEYSHGLSTRLTGGPANSGCLGFGEAGGMGEGWGDAFATLIRQTTEYGTHEEEYGMGAWAANRKSGIRNFVYSANMTSNPSTFKTLDKPGYWGVHAIGEVWAEMLFVVEQRLIAKHGFSKTLFPPVNATEPNDYYLPVNSTLVAGRPSTRPRLVPKHGNTLLAQLLVDGMKLQPCRPSFAAARDAIIQADLMLTGGNNTCDIWKGFAERGMGPEAKTLGQLPWGGGIRSEDFTVPKICGTKPKPKH